MQCPPADGAVWGWGQPSPTVASWRSGTQITTWGGVILTSGPFWHRRNATLRGVREITKKQPIWGDGTTTHLTDNQWTQHSPWGRATVHAGGPGGGGGRPGHPTTSTRAVSSGTPNVGPSSALPLLEMGAGIHSTCLRAHTIYNSETRNLCQTKSPLKCASKAHRRTLLLS